jgi:hypothetical protein
MIWWNIKIAKSIIVNINSWSIRFQSPRIRLARILRQPTTRKNEYP